MATWRLVEDDCLQVEGDMNVWGEYGQLSGRFVRLDEDYAYFVAYDKRRIRLRRQEDGSWVSEGFWEWDD
ncbi:hypothetical protein C8P63_1497 [Melghirimyces profundicolus]|uniref:Uncharacterized protein n=1 Tax=Melghirimyces profundicolus TaxID=1242148 RepID=A0A2T6AVK3_9BACL|nr:hypothetical protein [Melghirimyces profundicolus]PTX47842.1 hypothetical protein C8P63_1497 [Melghirimyces profundicolus]